MNPFLERLAARSLEAMPVLQPRRASRFEATETSGAPEIDSGVLAQPIQQAVAPSPSTPVPTAPSTPTRPDAAGPLPKVRNSLPNLSEPDPQPRRRMESFPPDEPLKVERTPLLAPPEPSIWVQTVHVPTPLSESRRAAQRADGLIRDVPPLLVNAPQVSLPAEPRPLRPRDGGAPTPSPHVEHREDIHISIGRIEIRAVPAKSDPAAKRTPSKQPSSLDTYLQQRNDRGHS